MRLSASGEFPQALQSLTKTLVQLQRGLIEASSFGTPKAGAMATPPHVPVPQAASLYGESAPERLSIAQQLTDDLRPVFARYPELAALRDTLPDASYWQLHDFCSELKRVLGSDDSNLNLAENATAQSKARHMENLEARSIIEQRQRALTKSLAEKPLAEPLPPTLELTRKHLDLLGELKTEVAALLRDLPAAAPGVPMTKDVHRALSALHESVERMTGRVDEKIQQLTTHLDTQEASQRVAQDKARVEAAAEHQGQLERQADGALGALRRGVFQASQNIKTITARPENQWSDSHSKLTMKRLDAVAQIQGVDRTYTDSRRGLAQALQNEGVPALKVLLKQAIAQLDGDYGAATARLKGQLTTLHTGLESQLTFNLREAQRAGYGVQEAQTTLEEFQVAVTRFYGDSVPVVLTEAVLADFPAVQQLVAVHHQPSPGSAQRIHAAGLGAGPEDSLSGLDAEATVRQAIVQLPPHLRARSPALAQYLAQCLEVAGSGLWPEQKEALRAEILSQAGAAR